jgi:hypothetical protein
MTCSDAPPGARATGNNKQIPGTKNYRNRKGDYKQKTLSVIRSLESLDVDDRKDDDDGREELVEFYVRQWSMTVLGEMEDAHRRITEPRSQTGEASAGHWWLQSFVLPVTEASAQLVSRALAHEYVRLTFLPPSGTEGRPDGAPPPGETQAGEGVPPARPESRGPVHESVAPSTALTTVKEEGLPACCPYREEPSGSWCDKCRPGAAPSLP